MAIQKRDAVLPLLAAAGIATLMVAERRSPLRARTQREPDRTMRNLVMGALSMSVVAAAEAPLMRRLVERVARDRLGLAQRLKLPTLAQDAVALLLMDYTIYVWHILTHKVPLLWRFHLVHHIDLDMDSSTALRFDAADMLISIPWRAAQVLLIGASGRAFAAWQVLFFTSVLFHHSNLRLPDRLERRLALILTTPRMHGIHHTAAKDRTDANWSSGLSIWDHLHGTFRLDVPEQPIRIGVPGVRDPAATRLRASLAAPFRRQPDAWATPGERG